MQCCNDRGPKAYRIIVQRLKREPGEGRFASYCPSLDTLPRRGYPCREKCRLPTTGGGRDKRQRMSVYRIQFTEQARALHKGDWKTWRRELAREQCFLLLGRLHCRLRDKRSRR